MSRPFNQDEGAPRLDEEHDDHDEQHDDERAAADVDPAATAAREIGERGSSRLARSIVSRLASRGLRWRGPGGLARLYVTPALSTPAGRLGPNDRRGARQSDQQCRDRELLHGSSLRPWITRIRTVTTAKIKRMWMNPPRAYEVTNPTPQSTNKITATVQSMVCLSVALPTA